VVVPQRKTIISAPYSGYIRKIYVHVGQKVQAGDPIVSIAQSVRSQDEEVHPLRAPFSGTVVHVLKTEGEFVEQTAQGNSTNGIVRIDDLSRLYIEATAPEIEVTKLKTGQEGVVKALAILNQTYSGRIENISLAAKEQDKWERSRVEFPILLRILNADSQLKPGMSVIVDITTKKLPQVLALRHEFIQKEKDRYLITTPQGEKKQITVGTQNEEVFEVISGLREGDKVRQVDFMALIKE
jgi:multidrug efflux pump subunit AcrA (membrane-fusion protein)